MRQTRCSLLRQPNRDRIAVANNNESGHQFFCNADAAKNHLACNRMTWYHSNGSEVPTDEKCRAPCRRQEISGPTCNLCINTHWGFPKCKECFCNKNGVGNPSKVRLCDETNGACKCKTKALPELGATNVHRDMNFRSQNANRPLIKT